jgi:DNA polymerase-3 subunit alpha
MSALLTSERENTEKIVKYIEECRQMRISVLPPDINQSGSYFQVEGDKIRFGLAAVKNVGEAAIQAILSARSQQGGFASLFDLCEFVDLRVVNRRVIESLIKSGAMDCLGGKRSQMMASLDRAMEMGSSLQRSKMDGQRSLLDLIAKDQRAPQRAPNLPQLEEWPATQVLAMEKEVLGFYLSGHPLRDFEDQIRRWASCNIVDLSAARDKDRLTLCGVVGNVKKIQTKNGGQMAFMTLEDLSGSVEVVVFPEVYANAASFLTRDLPLMVVGSVDVSEDGIKVLAQEISPLSEGKQKSSSRADVYLKQPDCPLYLLVDLREILGRHAGECPVFLHITSGQGRETIVAAGERFLVSPGEGLKRELEALLGDQCVRFA